MLGLAQVPGMWLETGAPSRDQQQGLGITRVPTVCLGAGCAVPFQKWTREGLQQGVSCFPGPFASRGVTLGFHFFEIILE